MGMSYLQVPVDVWYGIGQDIGSEGAAGLGIILFIPLPTRSPWNLLDAASVPQRAVPWPVLQNTSLYRQKTECLLLLFYSVSPRRVLISPLSISGTQWMNVNTIENKNHQGHEQRETRWYPPQSQKRRGSALTVIAMPFLPTWGIPILHAMV